MMLEINSNNNNNNNLDKTSVESLNKKKIDDVENRKSEMEDKDYLVKAKDKFFKHMNILGTYGDIYWRALEKNENT